MSQDEQQETTPANPIVFFDIALGRQLLGRVKFELFANDLPKTSENFRQFCTGEYKKDFKPLGYKNTVFHRVIKGFMIQGGDFVKGDGRGSMSIFGKDEFEDEAFLYEHKPMMLSMANSGPNTNGCQFFICCADLPHLDGKHVVFGRVIEGQEIIKKIEHVSVGENDRPTIDINVVECGEY